MQPYHLAKLVEWAGTLQTRKRLQKVAYLLQASGCDELDVSYILHHYGPYSSEVASMADHLTRMGMIEEGTEPNGMGGIQYSYQLSQAGRRAVRELEQGPEARKLVSFCKFEAQARDLLNRSMGELEYGATMVFFYRQTHDWNTAIKKTCEFKKLKADGKDCQTALKLAKTIVH